MNEWIIGTELMDWFESDQNRKFKKNLSK